MLNSWDPAHLTPVPALQAGSLVGMTHGITPDKHPCPIALSHVVGNCSRRGVRRVGLLISSALILKRASAPELAFFHLTFFSVSVRFDDRMYAVVGTVVATSGFCVRRTGQVIGQGRVHAGSGATRDGVRHMLLVHGFIGDRGVGAFLLVISTVPASSWVRRVPGALFWLGTTVTQVLPGSMFGAPMGRRRLLASAPALARGGSAAVLAGGIAISADIATLTIKAAITGRTVTRLGPWTSAVAELRAATGGPRRCGSGQARDKAGPMEEGTRDGFGHRLHFLGGQSSGLQAGALDCGGPRSFCGCSLPVRSAGGPLGLGIGDVVGEGTKATAKERSVMIRVGIIGCGAIARMHLESYQSFPDRARVVALCDIYPDKAEAYRTRFGFSEAAVYPDHRALLDAGGVDLVSVATPPYTHSAIAVDCLDAGVHVLVEKPMAASLEECDAMLFSADRSGRLLSVVAQNRFRAEMMKLKAVLAENLIGRVLHAEVDSFWWRGQSYYDLWWRGTWEREGGGPTLNHAVHHLDALQWMMGLPSEVRAVMGNVVHPGAEVEDLSVAVFRWPEGAIGQAVSSVVHHGQEQQIVFQGERARVSMPWRVVASKAQENGFPLADEEAAAEIQRRYEAFPAPRHEHHRGQIDNVLGALETGSPPLIDGREGRKTLELITAIYEAAATDATVRLPLSPADPCYGKAGLLGAMPRFHRKTVSRERFLDNEITT